MKTTKLKAPFAWVGGKSKLASKIIPLMPPHIKYVEVSKRTKQNRDNQ